MTTLETTKLEALHTAAEEMIQYSANVYKRYKTLADIYVYTNMFPYHVNNFKDSLFHLKELSQQKELADNPETTDQTAAVSVVVQFELIAEHLTRGVTDAVVDTLQYAARLYYLLLRSVRQEINAGRITDGSGLIHTLRKGLHLCRDKVLDLRLGKIDLGRISHWETHGPDEAFRDFIGRTYHECLELHGELFRLIQDANMSVLYSVAVRACNRDRDICRVNTGDSLASIASAQCCSVGEIIRLNVKWHDFLRQTTPNESTISTQVSWLLVPYEDNE